MSETIGSKRSMGMAVQQLLEAHRKVYAAAVLAGHNPPTIPEQEDATQDYGAPENEEQAILYAMATLRQAIHLFQQATFGGGM